MLHAAGWREPGFQPGLAAAGSAVGSDFAAFMDLFIALTSLAWARALSRLRRRKRGMFKLPQTVRSNVAEKDQKNGMKNGQFRV